MEPLKVNVAVHPLNAPDSMEAPSEMVICDRPLLFMKDLIPKWSTSERSMFFAELPNANAPIDPLIEDMVTPPPQLENALSSTPWTTPFIVTDTPVM